jgi:glycerate kinase
LLTQATRGLPSRAIHDLAAAVVEGAAEPVLEDALQVVLGIGCSSGADACMGMIAACRFSFLTAEGHAA